MGKSARVPSGFTLIELIVAMAIMAGLTAVMLPQMSRFRTQKALPDAAEQVQTAIRLAQSNATSGTICKGRKASGEWHFELKGKNSYTIDSTCSDYDPATPTPSPEPTILPANVSIVGVNICSPYPPTGSIADYSGFGVSFKSIDGTVSFLQPDGTSCPTTDALNAAVKMTITLQLGTNASDQSKIVVEKGGAVYVSSK